MLCHMGNDYFITQWTVQRLEAPNCDKIMYDINNCNNNDDGDEKRDRKEKLLTDFNFQCVNVKDINKHENQIIFLLES